MYIVWLVALFSMCSYVVFVVVAAPLLIVFYMRCMRCVSLLIVIDWPCVNCLPLMFHMLVFRLCALRACCVVRYVSCIVCCVALLCIVFACVCVRYACSLAPMCWYFLRCVFMSSVVCASSSLLVYVVFSLF